MNWHNVILRPQNLYEEILRRKLISGGGVPAVLQTVTGISPLTLLNVASKGIKSLTQFGKCEQASTPTPSVPVNIKCNNGTIKAKHEIGSDVADPVEVYADGTPEVLTVSGANMLNPTTVPNDGKYIAKVNGQVAGTGSTWAHSGFIPVEEGKKYYFGYKPFTASTAGMAWYDLSKTYISGKSATEIKNSSQKLTAPSGASFVRFTWSTANGYDTDWRNTVYFCENGAMTKFEPYVTPQTASVANLFAVGDYKDEQEIISGDVTHKVGLWVLNGQELWELNSVYGKTDNAFLSRNVVPFAQNSKTLLCTHFVNKESVETSGNVSVGVFAGSQISFFCGKNSNINSVDAWKTWLATQYANGTPVVIVYPLAEPMTEQVTAQHLTARDTATITAQTNNISDITLEVQYWENAE